MGMTRFGCVFVYICFFLTGCEKIQDAYTLTTDSHTVAAVGACMRKAGSTLVSESSSRAFCASQQETTFFGRETSGFASYSAGSFSGSLTNEDPNFVITGITITSEFLDADGNYAETKRRLTNLWLEPGKTHEFLLKDFDGPTGGNLYFPKVQECMPDAKNQKDCWLGWYSSEVIGVYLQWPFE